MLMSAMAKKHGKGGWECGVGGGDFVVFVLCSGGFCVDNGGFYDIKFV